MFGADGGSTGIDDEFAARGFENIGAWIMGRNMFGPVRGSWLDDSWKGWWGDNPPYHTPVFVLPTTRRKFTMSGSTTFHFVADGIHAALRRAGAATPDILAARFAPSRQIGSPNLLTNARGNSPAFSLRDIFSPGSTRRSMAINAPSTFPRRTRHTSLSPGASSCPRPRLLARSGKILVLPSGFRPRWPNLSRMLGPQPDYLQ